MFNSKASLVLLLFFIPGSSLASPAAWFKWRSKLDSAVVCSQTTPGDGWEKFTGPYRDARCEKLKTATQVLAAHGK
jgi:hypothetical protein